MYATIACTQYPKWLETSLGEYKQPNRCHGGKISSQMLSIKTVN